MIKLLVSIAGDDFAHNPKDVVSFDKEFEARLVESGQAEYVKPEKKAPVKK